MELKEILNNKQSEENLHLNGMGRRGDEGLLEPDVTSELQKVCIKFPKVFANTPTAIYKTTALIPQNN